MRVTTGLYKGRTIATVNDRSVRPATDRVRQAIFNILTNRISFERTHVLDLFAGSGSLGIEALSRGAARAVFVENDQIAASFIRKNIEQLGCGESVDIVVEDAQSYLLSAHESFDLVFADPPYVYEQTQPLPLMLFQANFVRYRGYLVIEHTTDLSFPPTALYSVGPLKRFGKTCVTFFQPSDKGSASA